MIPSGKAFVLNKFHKTCIPSVKFFANQLTKKEENLSDEDVFICFIIVTLNTFSCPNSSVTPSYKHFGNFSDVGKAKDFYWSGYVLNWLLESIKVFKKAKSSKANEPTTLGGCLYYLGVLYLDYVDFGPRRLPHTFPCISFWMRYD